jgi:hypothetical protein
VRLRAPQDSGREQQSTAKEWKFGLWVMEDQAIASIAQRETAGQLFMAVD